MTETQYNKKTDNSSWNELSLVPWQLAHVFPKNSHLVHFFSAMQRADDCRNMPAAPACKLEYRMADEVHSFSTEAENYLKC